MGITGINSIQDFNYNIRKPEPAEQAAKTVIKEIPEQQSRVQTSQSIDSTEIQPAEQNVKASANANAQLDDISITFHKQDDFGYIGRDSDIHSLDVEKALSDMRKDQILQQYQYFVGSKTTFVE